MSLIARKVWQAMALGCLVLAASLAGCKATPPEEGRPAEPTGPHATLLKLFPRPGDVTDWKAAGKVEVFGPSANAEQEVQAVELDPGVEAALVRGYGYVKSALGRYERTGVGERMALRVFEMDSPSEAFGLFSLCTQGLQFPPIGLAVRQGERTLGFVKGPYFVWLQYEGPGTAEPALKEFGEWVDGQIVSKGYRPAVLESFPIGSVQSERYYLHTFETLAPGVLPRGRPGRRRPSPGPFAGNRRRRHGLPHHPDGRHQLPVRHPVCDAGGRDKRLQPVCGVPGGEREPGRTERRRRPAGPDVRGGDPERRGELDPRPSGGTLDGAGRLRGARPGGKRPPVLLPLRPVDGNAAGLAQKAPWGLLEGFSWENPCIALPPFL